MVGEKKIPESHFVLSDTGRPKRTDLDLSKVFVGTCPDMCPEKERYMRETRNQLSVFEVIPDTEMVMALKTYVTLLYVTDIVPMLPFNMEA